MEGFHHRTREQYEQEERERLAPWAARAGDSAGRLVSEPEHPYRTAFQRDRDRIVHARAFRRLEFKTQVFVYVENDHYRNRLTHTIEAAQMARSIARALYLNEDLAEAIVLAHDLGHTPFGHAGEAVLDACMEADGGFDHNRQSLRVVDLLESRYPEWSGLNLTQETREGILKHGAPWPHPLPLPPAWPQRTLEAQAADHADEIAYIHHDLDDGLRSGLLSAAQLESTSLWKAARRLRADRDAHMPAPVGRARTIGALANILISDLIEETSRRLAANPPASLADLRQRRSAPASMAPGTGSESAESGGERRRGVEQTVGFSAEIEPGKRELKRFLSTHFYRHPDVLRRVRKAEWIVGDLFRAYRDDPYLLPVEVRERFAREGEARAVADYIAGMTDRFAMGEHRKLFDPHAPI
ncbi:MAG: dNTP triphosphohydrolase [Myxococcota bacterium]